MRILDLNNFYTPTGGGVRTYHNRKADHARLRQQHRQILLVPDDHWRIRTDGWNTWIHAPGIDLGGSGYRLVASERVVRRVIDLAEPDLIEIGSPYILPLLVPRALAQLGASVPVVGFYHADYPHAYVHAGALVGGPALQSMATELALRHMGRTYRGMTATLAASDYALQKLHRYGVQRLFHTPLGVDTSTFRIRPREQLDEVRSRVGAGPDTRVVLFLGRLAGMKRIDMLIDAWPELRRIGNLVLLIVGHGPYSDAVDHLVARFPEVHRLPFLSDANEVATIYAAADAYLSLGEWETFSLTTLEAMASGTPVIAPDGGAAGELVRRSGVLEGIFTPGSRSDLVRAVVSTLSLNREATRQELSGFAHAHFPWSRSLEHLIGIQKRIARSCRNGTMDQDLTPSNERWHKVPGLPPVRI
ncbi:MAG: glycosyltransferase [Deltaproteobacteria bacterium]|nr:MAG: glycosyltransferase [Deltaproteobacteria bacterium]